jgi:23S rRNA (adenine1618-N6)-methyltransferase
MAWQFTGVDIDPVAIKSAQQIAKANALDVDLRLQGEPRGYFRRGDPS